MAALGKIRSKGKILAIVIGLALFAFIAEELFRSCESTRNDQRQQVGQVLGKKVSVQEFQALFDEYQSVIKLQQGTENLTEDQSNQVKDMVWNTYIQSQILAQECKKLGLTVTDQEMQNILTQGTNQLLMQTPFVNQETGLFDVNQLKKFLADYKSQQVVNPQLAAQYETIYNYWTFIEKTLRQQVLTEKYQALLAGCLVNSNIEAEATFANQTEESSIELASWSFNDVNETEITVKESELKKKYESLKPMFRQYQESRDVQYIDILVEASESDLAELNAQMNEYKAQLDTMDVAEVVRKSTSLVSYLGMPVKKNAFPSDITKMIDSLSVGQVSEVFETKRDNTLNVMKIVSKQTLPDSVEYRQIQVFEETVEASRVLADSIYQALKGGADFELIAKAHNQTGAKVWLTTAQYQSSSSMDTQSKEYINTLNTLGAGEIKNMELEQGNLIIQVVTRTAMVDKYQVAVVKKTQDFSRETYSAAYNKFSAFVSANQKGEDLVKNAESEGYVVKDYKDLSTSAHNLANIRGTRDALKWAFEAKENAVSPMYECGENNHLLVVVLSKVHKKGYRDLSDESVKEYCKNECIKDKKAEVLMAKAEACKSIEDAKKAGAKTAEVKQIVFSNPVFASTTGSSEPALAGAVSATAEGKFSSKPVVGNAGVYVFQVTGKGKREAEYNATDVKQQLQRKAMQAAQNYTNELMINADVTDNRYLFF